MPVVTIAVEGIVDSVVAKRICGHLGLAVGPVHVKNGKRNLDPKLRAYNHAAAHSPWFVLRDLDFDESCPAELRRLLLPVEAPGMRLRVPVRTVESWLLADRLGLAQYLGVNAVSIPENPDDLDRPKQELINVARLSPKRLVREDIVPEPGMGTEVGPGFTQRITEFVNNLWEPDRAAQSSPSLRRALKSLSF